MTGAGDGPPPLRLRRRLAWIGAGLAAWVAYRLLSGRPELAEAVVGSGPLAFLPLLLSRLSGIFPFSLAELLIVAFVGRQVLGTAGGIRQARRGADAWGRTFLRGGLRLGQDVGALVLLFYLLWGFQYARPGVEARMGVAAVEAVDVEELEALALEAVRATNRIYLELHGTDDAGEPTRALSWDSLTSSLEEGWRAVEERHDLGVRTGRHGTPKPLLATPLVKRLGIGGFHFPFTGEALVLRDLPASRQGLTLAHEMAHQRGVARESDANVLAFLVAREAPHPLARYGAYFFLHRQLAWTLAEACPECAREVRDERLPGVVRDAVEAARYWAVADGPAALMATRLNHTMLRSHGIPEGVASYRGSAGVFVALARRDGPGALFPSRDEPMDQVPSEAASFRAR